MKIRRFLKRYAEALRNCVGWIHIADEMNRMEKEEKHEATKQRGV